MSLIHGTQGKVYLNSTEVRDVVEWELREESELHRYTSSATGPVPATLCGKRQLQGTCHLALSTDFDPGALFPGSSVTLKLYLDANRVFEIPARVTELSFLKSKRTGDPDLLQFHFVNDGPWTRPTWN